MKKRMRITHPYRVLAVLLLLATIAVAIHLPTRMVQIERLEEQNREAMQAYYAAQKKNNKLTEELAECGTPEYMERMARRLRDFCWNGDIIYTVENYDEIFDRK